MTADRDTPIPVTRERLAAALEAAFDAVLDATFGANVIDLTTPKRAHEPSLVLELVGRPPNYGAYCLACAKPWPCPDADPGPLT